MTPGLSYDYEGEIKQKDAEITDGMEDKKMKQKKVGLLRTVPLSCAVQHSSSMYA